MKKNNMDHYLTNEYYLKGIILGLMEIIFPFRGKEKIICHYKKIKYLKDDQNNSKFKVSLCLDEDGEKVVLKTLFFKSKNLDYEMLLNEANILKLVEGRSFSENGYTVKFPRLKRINIIKNNLQITREFMDGEVLSDMKDLRIDAAFACVKALQKLSSQINKKVYDKLPKKTFLIILLSLPIYMVRVLLKSNNRNLFLKTIITIIRNVPLVLLLKPNYILVHKDLRSRNIIVKGKEVSVLDLEYMALADELTDFAIIARVYYGEIKKNEMIKIILERINNKIELKKFIFLNLYYTIQVLAIAQGNKDYKNADNYLRFFFSDLFPILKKNIN